MHWDTAFDQHCERLVAAAAAGDTAAWQALIAAVAPELEHWAARHPTLRRWRLNGPDDTRAVLVRVIERLAARRRAALTAYTTRSAARRESDELDRLTRLDELDELDPSEPAATPVRAWLKTVLRHALHDHVRQRLGWVQGMDRRAVGSDAARWSEQPEPGARPALTDWLTVRARMAEVDAAINALPDPMPQAVRLWAAGHEPDEIAAALHLPDAPAARRLVRAAHARLRGALRAVSEADE
jgi:DNA-directed RNA polymerase specialized sigma24 family protein